MKQFITGIAILLVFASCKNENKAIVSVAFTDSLLNNYSDATIKNAIETDLQFWKNRIEPANPGQLNELKYAGCLVQRFHLTGNMQDLVTADSILFVADRAFEHKEKGANMALIRNSILQHRFKMADSLLKQVKNTGIKKYESATLSFDVAFELGYYPVATFELKQIASPTDYGYNFRRAKLAHYKGELDTAIAAMHRATELAAGNVYLKQAALSNEADLNLHNGNLQRANDLYAQSIRLGATDLHSIMALGWIALVHDKNDSLAEKIFRFIHSKTNAPDAVFKLAQLADARGDSAMQKKYASEFVGMATASVYGNMYNKYLLELYTGILNEPAKGEAIAARELLNRTTPQTYAWYVWALYSNNKTAEAEKIYRQHVSGKPLEGLELYWMGKYMQAQNKGYNAEQFFKAAYKNRYDLSPAMVKYLQKTLGE
ncbi:MAG: hypothetical protein IPI88_04925 [Chitinophagaceae bacterium]|nr:hypothetical protein [Chitinophagaceae bacterium]